MIELRYDPDISATLSLIFTRVSTISKFGLIVAFEALQFRNEAMYLKSETCLGSACDTFNSVPIAFDTFSFRAHKTCVQIKMCIKSIYDVIIM